ncbi:DUF805 domain-containing protein [Sphingomonas sp. ERG5]|uniref:DUF805 domain-containing protein n=1 Tax=Sphingomonas sp. ERG5 TaxID=1381597 RepID=UPI00054B179D|nr:DUF805 domain-containing protein [Sphingomonas sp. ERG5]
MEFMILPLKRYFQFSGRSRRKEYWVWTLFVVIANIVLALVDAGLGLDGSSEAAVDGSATSFAAAAYSSSGVLGNIFSLATLIPGIAVTVRRLHDVNRSGLWLLAPIGLLVAFMVVALAGIGTGAFIAPGMVGLGIVAVLALIGFGILLLVWTCTAGTNGPNRFGEDPKDDKLDHLAETFS